MTAGCAGSSTGDDPIDDSFLGGNGKTDTGISEGSPEARGVLKVVNSKRYRELKDNAGLAPNAAWNIVMHRAGPDELDNTADDDPFDSLAELDAVPFVGAGTFSKLVEYADELGLIDHGSEGPLLARIEALDAMFPAGRGAGKWDVKPSTPTDMLQEYMDTFYEPDDWEILENEPAFDVDTSTAGTVTVQAAHAAVRRGIVWMWESSDEDSIPRRQDEASAALDAIVEAGGILAYDGAGQNGCAAPTLMLLVIDVKAGYVYGIDLEPCDES